MNSIYNSQSIYPANKINAVDIVADALFEITNELAHNPAKVAIAIYGSVDNAAELWLVNHIKNPFKELVVGKILRIPSAISISKTNSTSTSTKPIQVRNAKINGQKITY